MQWLINIIKAWIETQGYALQSWVQAQGYLTTSYVDRAPSITWDWTQAALTMDYTWRELDLSGIIPEGVKAVNIFVLGQHVSVAKHLKLSQYTVAGQRGETVIRTLVANLAHVKKVAIGVTTDRKMYYKIEAPNWSAIQMKIKGWWF